MLQSACDYTKKTVIALKPFAEKAKSDQYLYLTEGFDQEIVFDDILMYAKKCILLVKDIWKAEPLDKILDDPDFSAERMNKILDVHGLQVEIF